MKIRNISVSTGEHNFEGAEANESLATIRVSFQSVGEALAFTDAVRALCGQPRVAQDPVEAAKVVAAPSARATKPKPEPEPEDDDDDAVEVIDKPTVKVTKELKNATKLRDVLRILIDAGITSKKALVRECKALQPHVPVLERIEDLEGRVPKAAEIVNPDIEA